LRSKALSGLELAAGHLVCGANTDLERARPSKWELACLPKYGARFDREGDAAGKSYTSSATLGTNGLKRFGPLDFWGTGGGPAKATEMIYINQLEPKNAFTP
jgi:hypothetical protein